MSKWVARRLHRVIFPAEPEKPKTAMRKCSPETARLMWQHWDAFNEITELAGEDAINLARYVVQKEMKRGLDQVFVLGVITGLALGPALTLALDVLPLIYSIITGGD